jgi:phage-related protein
MNGRRPIAFSGDSLEELRQFPELARRRAGYQLDRVQCGLEPDDWKPMNSIGIREIRIRDEAGIFRVMYVTKFGETLYVLHCFQKKNQKTSVADLTIAVRRYKQLQKEYLP